MEQSIDLTPIQTELLKGYAAKYIWWKTPDEAMEFPLRILAQVMDIGEFEDAMQMRREFGDDTLKSVLSNAEAGWFRPKSWYFWHQRLHVCEYDHVPELPTRKFTDDPPSTEENPYLNGYRPKNTDGEDDQEHYLPTA